MLNEGAYTGETNESIEHRGGFPRETLKRILESRNSITDFGKSGIVFRVGPEDLSPEDQAMMATADGGNEENPEGTLSIKALKVFDLALARKEFEALKEARRIILEDREGFPGPLAKIPRAFGFDEMEVDAATRDLLNANGAAISKEGKVGIITMDWIEGKDLSVVLKEELSKLTPPNEDFYPGQDKDIKNGNFGELIRSLEKKGFVLPQAILAQIENTITVMHGQNFYHNDIHLRNLILKNGDLENPEIYMIDFADAGDEELNIQNAEGKYFLSDENIVKSLAPLTTSSEAKQKAHEKTLRDEWEQRVSIVEKNPRSVEQYKILKDALDAGRASALEDHFAVSSGTNADLDNFFGNLLRLSRDNAAYHDTIKLFLTLSASQKKTRMSHYVLQRMNSLLGVMES